MTKKIKKEKLTKYNRHYSVSYIKTSDEKVFLLSNLSKYNYKNDNIKSNIIEDKYDVDFLLENIFSNKIPSKENLFLYLNNGNQQDLKLSNEAFIFGEETKAKKLKEHIEKRIIHCEENFVFTHFKSKWDNERLNSSTGNYKSFKNSTLITKIFKTLPFEDMLIPNSILSSHTFFSSLRMGEGTQIPIENHEILKILKKVGNAFPNIIMDGYFQFIKNNGKHFYYHNLNGLRDNFKLCILDKRDEKSNKLYKKNKNPIEIVKTIELTIN